MNFTIYSKDGCSYCSKIEQVLEYSKLSYRVYKLGRQFTKEQFTKEFGDQSGFPKVLVDGKLIGGCTDTIKYLQEKKLI
jgi:glutaredoxin